MSLAEEINSSDKTQSRNNKTYFIASQSVAAVKNKNNTDAEKYLNAAFMPLYIHCTWQKKKPSDSCSPHA